MASITRLAPSPTGALHLGNARTFVVNWLLARQRGWKILLRIEDIDGPRVKRGMAQQLIEDFKWLGLDWDEGPIYQSRRLEQYKLAMDQLVTTGRAYACVCSRKEVESAASAPHAEDGAAVYPGTCRDKFESLETAFLLTGRTPAIRFRVSDGQIEYTDCFAGPQEFDPQRQLGDFVIAKADRTPAYQLAVVVDDADMGVTDVVRGNDLLDSTPRQILIYRALGRKDRIPRYYHLPLVVGPDGRRLAKRHGDTRLSYYRLNGVSPQRVLALIARWSGIANAPAELSLADLLQWFDFERMPREPIVFGRDDDSWLLSGNL